MDVEASRAIRQAEVGALRADASAVRDKARAACGQSTSPALRRWVPIGVGWQPPVATASPLAAERAAASRSAAGRATSVRSMARAGSAVIGCCEISVQNGGYRKCRHPLEPDPKGACRATGAGRLSSAVIHRAGINRAGDSACGRESIEQSIVSLASAFPAI
jgi:hypothetical protein